MANPLMSDLIKAKQELSNRLLKGALLSGVMARTATLRVAAAVSVAGRNVHAVGIGEKLTDGKSTGQRCLRMYVVQKLAKSLLPPRDLLPSTIAGLPTDVIESPPAFVQAKRRRRAAARTAVAAALAAPPSCSQHRREQQRPMAAGISVAHRMVTAGTIGYFCRSTRAGDDPEQVYLLSNNHVLANVNSAAIGDDVYQPGPLDGGTAEDHAADLHRFVPIHLGGQTSNRVDGAIVAVRPDVAHQLEVCSIGRIADTASAAENMAVRKHGRTTGLTEGLVTDVFYDALVGMDHFDTDIVARFENQIRIDGTPTSPIVGLGGDSGSLVVQQDSLTAIGLYFAGPDSGQYGVANHLADVLQELQIELLT